MSGRQFELECFPGGACRRLEDGGRICAEYAEGREVWTVVDYDERGELLTRRERPGRLTLEEALRPAEDDSSAAANPPLAVLSLRGRRIGNVFRVRLPRFWISTASGLIALRVDAIFDVSPAGLTLVGDGDDLEKYRTEQDRRSVRERTLVCSWCGRLIHTGALPAAFAFCCSCEDRDDVDRFPYGSLVGR